jgi:hypothetical protein
LQLPELRFAFNFVEQLSILLKFLNHMIRFFNGVVSLFCVPVLQLLKVRADFLVVILQHVTTSSLFGQGHLPLAHVELFVRIGIQLFIFVFVKLIREWQTHAPHFAGEVIWVVGFQILVGPQHVEVILVPVSRCCLEVVDVFES